MKNTKKSTQTLFYTTDDGVKVLQRHTGGKIAHLAFIFNIGSRDELPEEHGMAHYIEHCLFKGTHLRRSAQVLSRLENVGGEMNAYTTKENICLHSSFMPEYIGRAIELFSDIAFNSSYPTHEIDKEKEVIEDEINAYREAPDELIFEQAEELLYPQQSLGRTILGTKDSLDRFTREDILAFWDRNFSIDDMIVCVSGDFSQKKIKTLVEKHLHRYSEFMHRERPKRLRRVSPASENTFVERAMDTHQRHILMCSRAYPSDDSQQHLTLVLLNNMLGGPTMTSLLNMSLRERHALVYSVESFYTAYSDVGTAGIYIATDEDSWKRSISLTRGILDDMMNRPVSQRKLSIARRQLLGQMAIASENELNQLLSVGRAYMTKGYCNSFDDIRRRLENITPQDIMQVAREVYAPERVTTLMFKSEKNEE